jgi:vibriolysin
MLTPIAASIALVLCASSAMASEIKLNEAGANAPAFIAGQLGNTSSENTIAALKNIINSRADYLANGNEDFTIKRQWTDELGKQHTHMSQTINGLKVYGTSMIVHANKSQDNDFAPLGANSSEIYAVSGQLAVNKAEQSALKSLQSDLQGRVQAMKTARELGKMLHKPELAYVYLPLRSETKLAYKTEVSWDKGANDFGHDAIFLDAKTGELLTRHAKMHQAKNWKTHDINNLSENSINSSTAPGVLLCSNTQSCGSDNSAQRAHDSASSVYDYYKARFNRSSVNNGDLTLVSSVHVGNNYGNAFWYNNRMWYGDGDGTKLKDLTLAHDVVGHELTHGVVEYTAKLVYANASGALNEGFADILGVSAESYKNGNTQPDWKLGEEVMVQGGALRYMNNPTQDNYSTDWYPDRIPFVSNPSNSNDQGGVHGNSGIANLAYVLTVDGGTHPRGKSSANVSGIGLLKAEQIFYRALNTYMTASTNFAGARTATAQAATDLYGAAEVTAVNTAWCAVGVGTCPSTGGGSGATPINASVSNVSVSRRAWKRYTLAVGTGYSELEVNTSGGSGDADLYLRLNANSTTSNYNCRSWANGNSETCTIANPGAGTWHIDLYGYRASSGITLTATAN